MAVFQPNVFQNNVFQQDGAPPAAAVINIAAGGWWGGSEKESKRRQREEWKRRREHAEAIDKAVRQALGQLPEDAPEATKAKQAAVKTAKAVERAKDPEVPPVPIDALVDQARIVQSAIAAYRARLESAQTRALLKEYEQRIEQAKRAIEEDEEDVMLLLNS
jgi:hypothetical protein